MRATKGSSAAKMNMNELAGLKQLPDYPNESYERVAVADRFLAKAKDDRVQICTVRMPTGVGKSGVLPFVTCRRTNQPVVVLTATDELALVHYTVALSRSNHERTTSRHDHMPFERVRLVSIRRNDGSVQTISNVDDVPHSSAVTYLSYETFNRFVVTYEGKNLIRRCALVFMDDYHRVNSEVNVHAEMAAATLLHQRLKIAAECPLIALMSACELGRIMEHIGAEYGIPVNMRRSYDEGNIHTRERHIVDYHVNLIAVFLFDHRAELYEQEGTSEEIRSRRNDVLGKILSAPQHALIDKCVEATRGEMAYMPNGNLFEALGKIDQLSLFAHEKWLCEEISRFPNETDSDTRTRLMQRIVKEVFLNKCDVNSENALAFVASTDKARRLFAIFARMESVKTSKSEGVVDLPCGRRVILCEHRDHVPNNVLTLLDRTCGNLVISTGAFEDAFTINGLKYVFDDGHQERMCYHSERRTEQYKELPTTGESRLQRAGRVSRGDDFGYVFQFYRDIEASPTELELVKAHRHDVDLACDVMLAIINYLNVRGEEISRQMLEDLAANKMYNGIDKTTASHTITRLLADGVLKKKHNSGDALELTACGMATLISSAYLRYRAAIAYANSLEFGTQRVARMVLSSLHDGIPILAVPKNIEGEGERAYAESRIRYQRGYRQHITIAALECKVPEFDEAVLLFDDKRNVSDLSVFLTTMKRIVQECKPSRMDMLTNVLGLDARHALAARQRADDHNRAYMNCFAGRQKELQELCVTESNTTAVAISLLNFFHLGVYVGNGEIAFFRKLHENFDGDQVPTTFRARVRRMTTGSELDVAPIGQYVIAHVVERDGGPEAHLVYPIEYPETLLATPRHIMPIEEALRQLDKYTYYQAMNRINDRLPDWRGRRRLKKDVIDQLRLVLRTVDEAGYMTFNTNPREGGTVEDRYNALWEFWRMCVRVPVLPDDLNTATRLRLVQSAFNHYYTTSYNCPMCFRFGHWIERCDEENSVGSRHVREFLATSFSRREWIEGIRCGRFGKLIKCNDARSRPHEPAQCCMCGVVYEGLQHPHPRGLLSGADGYENQSDSETLVSHLDADGTAVHYDAADLQKVFSRQGLQADGTSRLHENSCLIGNHSANCLVCFECSDKEGRQNPLSCKAKYLSVLRIVWECCTNNEERTQERGRCAECGLDFHTLAQHDELEQECRDRGMSLFEFRNMQAAIVLAKYAQLTDDDYSKIIKGNNERTDHSGQVLRNRWNNEKLAELRATLRPDVLTMGVRDIATEQLPVRDCVLIPSPSRRNPFLPDPDLKKTFP